MTWPELRHLAGDVDDAEGYARWLENVEGQLLEAEERYRGLVETLPLATYIDRDDRLTGTAWVSPQIEAITSYAPAEWTSNPNLLTEVLHPDDRDELLAAVARAKENGETRENEYRIVRRDGSIVWVRDSAVTVVEGTRRHARGFVVDITERREAQLELARQNDQLRQLDKLKDEFIALVSHELRTPLTSIRGYLELMSEDENLSDEQTHFLGTIDRNAQRLQRLVGDLLFCAQVDAGKLTLETGAVDVNALVGDAIDAARPAAAAKAVALVAELGDLPEIEGDRARLAQVLDNFVSNAIKFTPGEGTVTVATHAYPGEIELSIADTGIGIPPDEVPHLFQRFFRTERATADAIPGTGLGLAIAKAIVTGHGGRLRVASTVGAGTTFRIILPG
jgi:PAS domain S-box-containing protein